MSFGEEFRELNPNLVERAYTNVNPDLRIITFGGAELAFNLPEYHDRIRQFSPGYLALIGRHEQATVTYLKHDELTAGTDSPLEMSMESFRMTQMSVGLLFTGLVLAEYARFEQVELE
jgi:hypothetical protein